MARVLERVARRVRRRLKGGGPAQTGEASPRQQVQRLRRRVADLEQEVQENRRLNRRIAELTDVVQEMLLPADQRDDESLRRRLEDYGAGR